MRSGCFLLRLLLLLTLLPLLRLLLLLLLKLLLLLLLLLLPLLLRRQLWRWRGTGEKGEDGDGVRRTVAEGRKWTGGEPTHRSPHRRPGGF